jgi:hypothetical protein
MRVPQCSQTQRSMFAVRTTRSGADWHTGQMWIIAGPGMSAMAVRYRAATFFWEPGAVRARCLMRIVLGRCVG